MIIVDGKPLLNPIVCNTNIWYDIANGLIKPEKFKYYNLIGTGVNIFELSSTPKMVKDPSKFWRALNAMSLYHKLIYKYNIFDHLIIQFDPAHEANCKTNEDLLERMSIFLSLNPLEDIPKENSEMAEKQIGEFLTTKRSIAELFNKRITEIREGIKDQQDIIDYRKLDLTKTHRHDISTLMESYALQHYNKNVTISGEDENWGRLEFFMTTWDIFFRNTILTKNKKVQANDIGDLFNLVYVQPGVRYATKEKKWKFLFKEDKLLSRYFIEL